MICKTLYQIYLYIYEMELKERVLQVINDNYVKNKGQVGLTAIQIMQAVNEDFASVKPVLNELYREDKIIFRKGLNHKLFYKKHDDSFGRKTNTRLC